MRVVSALCHRRSTLSLHSLQTWVSEKAMQECILFVSQTNVMGFGGESPTWMIQQQLKWTLKQNGTSITDASVVWVFAYSCMTKICGTYLSTENTHINQFGSEAFLLPSIQVMKIPLLSWLVCVCPLHQPRTALQLAQCLPQWARCRHLPLRPPWHHFAECRNYAELLSLLWWSVPSLGCDSPKISAFWNDPSICRWHVLTQLIHKTTCD